MTNRHRVNGRFAPTKECPNGHNKDKEGRTASGGCLKCKRERSSKYIRSLDSQFANYECVNRHDKRKVGVTAKGYCLECKRKRERLYMARKRQGLPKPKPTQYHKIPNLKQVRVNLGLTQVQLSVLSGVSEGHICDLENRKVKASEQIVRRIHHAVVSRQKQLKRKYALKRYGYRGNSAA